MLTCKIASLSQFDIFISDDCNKGGINVNVNVFMRLGRSVPVFQTIAYKALNI